MARRSDHSREELIALAIEKAIKLIDKNGLYGFSIREVAKEIGYTVGTLYHIFGNYDGLMFHINARTLDAWHAELDVGLKKKKRDKLHYLAHTYFSFAHRHYNRWTTLFEFHAESPMPDWYRQKVNALFNLIEETLLPYSKNVKKNKQSAKVIWASIHGICALSLSGKLENVNAAAAEVLIDEFLETYLRGL